MIRVLEGQSKEAQLSLKPCDIIPGLAKHSKLSVLRLSFLHSIQRTRESIDKSFNDIVERPCLRPRFLKKAD